MSSQGVLPFAGAAPLGREAAQGAPPHRPGPLTEERKRDEGKAKAEAKNRVYVALARWAAQRIALREGDADIERVRELLERNRCRITYGNWCGTVFNPKDWECTGRWVKCRHVGSRARVVRVWKLRRTEHRNDSRRARERK